MGQYLVYFSNYSCTLLKDNQVKNGGYRFLAGKTELTLTVFSPKEREEIRANAKGKGFCCWFWKLNWKLDLQRAKNAMKLSVVSQIPFWEPSFVISEFWGNIDLQICVLFKDFKVFLIPKNAQKEWKLAQKVISNFAFKIFCYQSSILITFCLQWTGIGF